MARLQASTPARVREGTPEARERDGERMGGPRNPAVVKVMKMAATAKRNGWHGNIDSEVLDGERVTVLRAERNGETLSVHYRGETMYKAEYGILGVTTSLHCPSLAIEKLESWPDVMKLFKQYPTVPRPKIVEQYRKLPFAFEDSNDEIIDRLIGKQLFWYSHTNNKIQVDVVRHPKKNGDPNFRIVDVGHRKLFHFIGVSAGFRSVLLDTVIKVG